MKKQPLPYAVYLLSSLTLAACSNHSTAPSEASEQANLAKIWPKLNIDVKEQPAMEQRINKMLQGMTLQQKVAQTIQPEIRDISVEDMRRYGFGSYLNGGGSYPDSNKHATAQDWVNLAEKMYQASIDDSLDGSTIPTMWGTDAVHGHNNVIGATLFPHNIGLGAAHDPALIKKIAKATAEEVLATGIDWVFAPTVAVVRDDRWGRTYEGYSEDPQIVKQYARFMVQGLQGNVGENFMNQHHVIATVKHFIGDGGTENGDDQGNTIATEQQLFKLHAQGYVGGLSAGAQTVMASFSSWNGVKNHGNHHLLTDVLKKRMGFDGLVVGDWNGHGQVNGCTNSDCPQAMNAGLDIFMVPSDWKALMANTIKEVQEGIIPQSRLDDAVRRILRVKMRAGLFTKPSPAHRLLAGKQQIIGSQAHRNIARRAVRESLVLLKNHQHILPLEPNQRVLVAGDGADNIGKQSGGWSITWQGTGNSNSDFPGASSIYDGIKQHVEQAGGSVELNAKGDFQHKPDVAIVVFGENPYAEGNGDISNLEYQPGNKTDLTLLKKLKAQHIPVISVFLSGRPLWVNPELNASDAFVAAWLPGSEGEGVADVLFRNNKHNIAYDFTGKLSYSWPRTPAQHVNRFDQPYNPLFPYGYGLTYEDTDTLGNQLDESSASQANSQPADINLYKLTIQSPWKIQISDNSGQADMASSVVKLPAISVQTTDWHVQEDALQLDWSGQQLATFKFTHTSAENWQMYQPSGANLVFDLHVKQAPAGPAYLGMDCDRVCDHGINLSPVLNQLADHDWQTLSVPLRCIGGVDLTSVYSPFVLQTASAMSLQLSNIRFSTEPKGKVISCPSTM